MRHELNEPCPEKAGPPIKFMWTDHKRPGLFNSCSACHEATTTIAEMLAALNEKRELEG